MLPRFEKLQSSTVPFLERKPTNRPIISSCCPWSQNPAVYCLTKVHAFDIFFWMVLVICFWKEWFYMGFSGCFVRCCRFPFCSWFVFRVLRTQNSPWHWSIYIAQLRKLYTLKGSTLGIRFDLKKYGCTKTITYLNPLWQDTYTR